MMYHVLTLLHCSVVIGAGAAGIMMAAKIPRYFKDGQVELQVYEKNHEGKPGILSFFPLTHTNFNDLFHHLI